MYPVIIHCIVFSECHQKSSVHPHLLQSLINYLCITCLFPLPLCMQCSSLLCYLLTAILCFDSCFELQHPRPYFSVSGLLKCILLNQVTKLNSVLCCFMIQCAFSFVQSCLPFPLMIFFFICLMQIIDLFDFYKYQMYILAK